MTIDVSLTPQLEEMVRQKVSSGLYSSVSEVVCEALRLMDAQDRLQAIKKEDNMNLEQVILSQNAKVNSALETLKANRKYQQDRLIYGDDRVFLYVDNVDGDWLTDWTNETEYVEQINPDT
jgi:antitoxin ParD1/3/4